MLNKAFPRLNRIRTMTARSTAANDAVQSTNFVYKRPLTPYHIYQTSFILFWRIRQGMSSSYQDIVSIWLTIVNLPVLHLDKLTHTNGA